MIPAPAARYTRAYFLGGIDSETGQKYGAAGAEAFKKGKVDGRYMRFLRTLPLKGRRVLDLGCGRGDIIRGTVRKATWVTGIDYSKDACILANKMCVDHGSVNVTLHCGNIDTFEFICKDGTPYRWDIIFLLDVIEHLKQEPTKYLPYTFEPGLYLRIWRGLKPSGILIIDTPIYKSKDYTDSSDLIPATQGMHCNKQTKKSLIADLTSHGFRMYSINIWGKGRWSYKIWMYAQSVRMLSFLWKVRKLRGLLGKR